MTDTKKSYCVDYVCDADAACAFLDGVGRGEWVCYMLRSTVKSNRTYAGVTNDLKHRLRQHNGELVGGARATHSFRPWKIAAVVRGFDKDKSKAMRFEWFLKMGHAPGAKPYIFNQAYVPPPKEQRVSGLCRRAVLFERAFEKTTGLTLKLTCLDADFGLAMSDRMKASAPEQVVKILRSTDRPEQQIHQ